MFYGEMFFKTGGHLRKTVKNSKEIQARIDILTFLFIFSGSPGKTVNMNYVITLCDGLLSTLLLADRQP